MAALRKYLDDQVGGRGVCGKGEGLRAGVKVWSGMPLRSLLLRVAAAVFEAVVVVVVAVAAVFVVECSARVHTFPPLVGPVVPPYPSDGV